MGRWTILAAAAALAALTNCSLFAEETGGAGPLPELRPNALTQPFSLTDLGGNPADLARGPDSRPAPSGTHTWELPPVNVVGERAGALREEDRVGSYAQPRWTTDRRFSETRLYVVPEGKIEFEHWLIPEAPRKGPSDIRQQYELEMGLPHRLQLDLYLITRKEAGNHPTFVDQALEVRYALADWGRIWGNPTIYLEYTFQDQAADLIETKLLLGDEISPRWHWGVNLSWEHQTGDEITNEYEFTGGVSYTLVDEKFSVGVELKSGITDSHGHRGSFNDEVLLGPSIQYRPLPQAHIDLAPLFGVTHESPIVQAFLILGWEF